MQELADSLRPHIIPSPRKYYQWGETQEPDVWFEPVKVGVYMYQACGLLGDVMADLWCPCALIGPVTANEVC